jgi:hypothetical protein
MKALKILLICGLVLGFAVPGFAAYVDDDEDWRFNITFLRYRFNWQLQSAFGTGDFSELMDDDFDTTWTFNKGDITAYFELEISDNTMGDDNVAQASYDDALGAFGGRWMPSGMADRELRLEFGDFGTGYGLRINNDDSPRGSVEVAWKAGAGNWVLGYGKTYEGDTNDDIEGDGHLIRGQVAYPLGESGMMMGAYLAFYLQDNVDVVAATEATVQPDPTDPTLPPVVIPPQPRVQGDQNVFLGSANLSGSLATFDFFSELGFSTGSRDEGIDSDGDGISDSTFSRDLSGFYITGGANFGAGNWTLGVEAGYAPGEFKDEEDTGFVGFNEDYGIGEILHDEGLIKNSDGVNTSLSNLIFAQLTGSTSFNKWDFFIGGVYFAPVETITSSYTGKEADQYGFEIYGNLVYHLTDYLSYTAFYGIAFPDSSFIADTQYQLVNRMEFLF